MSNISSILTIALIAVAQFAVIVGAVLTALWLWHKRDRSKRGTENHHDG